MSTNLVPNIKNIPLLAHPILHYTMFGVAPREIMGETAWKVVKKQTQARANHYCEICGRHVPHTMETKDWIHTHEVYTIDHKNRQYNFSHFVGICKECHYFIHQGYLHTLLTQGLVSEKYFEEVLDKGNGLLDLISLRKQANTTIEEPYTLFYEGEHYINDFYPEIALQLYTKGVKILHYNLASKKLPKQFYYKK